MSLPLDEKLKSKYIFDNMDFKSNTFTLQTGVFQHRKDKHIKINVKTINIIDNEKSNQSTILSFYEHDNLTQSTQNFSAGTYIINFPGNRQASTTSLSTALKIIENDKIQQKQNELISNLEQQNKQLQKKLTDCNNEINLLNSRLTKVRE